MELKCTILFALRRDPGTIWYEDLAATVETQGKIITSVLNFLGIKEKPTKWPPMAGITQQRDAYTQTVYQVYQNSKCGLSNPILH